MRETEKPLLLGTPMLSIIAIVLLIASLLLVNRYTDWFELRPASGTAAAMALAAEKTPAPK